MMEPTSPTARRLFRLYGVQAIAVLLFAACLLKVWTTHHWMDYWKSLLFALLGLVSFLAPDEVAMTTGRYGFTRDQWWEQPPEWVKWTGAVTLGVCTFLILTG
jgi:hypothetical protein